MWLDDADTDVVELAKQLLAVLSGGWAIVTVTCGALDWERCTTPPDPDPRQVKALRTGFGRSADADSLLDIDDRPPQPLQFVIGEGPVHEAIVVDRAAFAYAPVAPLADMYREAACRWRGRPSRTPTARTSRTCVRLRTSRRCGKFRALGALSSQVTGPLAPEGAKRLA